MHPSIGAHEEEAGIGRRRPQNRAALDSDRAKCQSNRAVDTEGGGETEAESYTTSSTINQKKKTEKEAAVVVQVVEIEAIAAINPKARLSVPL